MLILLSCLEPTLVPPDVSKVFRADPRGVVDVVVAQLLRGV